jgi:hypothetical protein
MTKRELDVVRGGEAATKLTSYGVTGVLIKAAELGYITDVRCKMPTCYCPEELGGASYFEPASSNSDWSPTNEHFPIPKRDGGRVAPANSILAHRLLQSA